MTLCNLTNKTDGHIRIHITPNVAMFRQYGFWYDTDKKLVCVPCTGFGFVIVTLPDVPLHGEPLLAWAVFRPCALSLQWEMTKKVDLCDISLNDATTWYNVQNRQWEHIRAKRANTQQW